MVAPSSEYQQSPVTIGIDKHSDTFELCDLELLIQNQSHTFGLHFCGHGIHARAQYQKRQPNFAW